MNSKQYQQFARSEMQAFLPDNYSKVLEVGCGAGGFIKSLGKSVESWGVEPNETTAKLAAEQIDKVLIGAYRAVSAEIPDNYFDLIICNDVIEHMQDYQQFLLNVKNKLSDGGNLLLSVPNVRFLPNLFELFVQRDWRYRDAGILDKTHLRFFTRKSLCRALEESGWVVDEIQGINRYGRKPFGPKRLLSYLFQVILGTDTAYLQFAVRAHKIT